MGSLVVNLFLLVGGCLSASQFYELETIFCEDKHCSRNCQYNVHPPVSRDMCPPGSEWGWYRSDEHLFDPLFFKSCHESGSGMSATYNIADDCWTGDYMSFMNDECFEVEGGPFLGTVRSFQYICTKVTPADSEEADKWNRENPWDRPTGHHGWYEDDFWPEWIGGRIPVRSAGKDEEASNASTSGEWYIYVIGVIVALLVFLFGSFVGYVVYTKRQSSQKLNHHKNILLDHST